jgi:hypothetical protein
MPREKPLRALLRELRRHAPQARHELEILERSELVVEHRLVRHPSQQALRTARVFAGVDPEHVHAARIGLEEACDHA